MPESDVTRIPLQLSRGCVVSSVQVDLSDEVLRRFRSDLLELLETSGSTGIVVDLAGVDVMDAEDFGALRRTLSMAAIMGARSVLCGLRPGVVAALVDLGADVDGVVAARSLDDALALLVEADEHAAAEVSPEQEPEPAEEEEESHGSSSAPDHG
jgi:rsbT antagonist protein RsbS